MLLNLNPVIQCLSHQYSQLFFFFPPLKARLYWAFQNSGRENKQQVSLLAGFPKGEGASLFLICGEGRGVSGGLER